MRVKLLRDSRINYKAGEIVEVSSAQANFLLSCKSAVLVEEPKQEPAPAPEAEEKPATKKKATKK